MVIQQARPIAPVVNVLPNPLIPAHLVSSNPTSPAASGQFNRRDSNGSLSDTTKKRKLNPTQANQAAPSSLKQTTLTNLTIPINKPSSGPGSRGSSAGPRSKKTSAGGPKKLAPHQAAAARKSGKPSSTNLNSIHHKHALKQALGAGNGRGIKGSASGSQSAEESADSRESGSDAEEAAGHALPPDTSNDAVREDEETEDVGETEGDDRKYCICQSVSHGDMVACDDEECPNEWFHWECVKLTKEPVGKWFCPDCDCRRKLLGTVRA
jgi:inhibitor of growth protein 3